jgi:ketosteroid isomerase-like protein
MIAGMVTAALVERVREAMEAGDLAAMEALLDPDVHWGAPDDGSREEGAPEDGSREDESRDHESREDRSAECVNRKQVMTWYRRAAAAGVRARVTEVVAGPDAILVGLIVSGTGESEASGGEVERWQVLTVGGGRVTDIRGFDVRATAAARAGVAP